MGAGVELMVDQKDISAASEDRGRAVADAAVRAQELAARRIRLASGAPATPDEVDLAQRRANDARGRAKRAHQSAAQRHRQAAATHDLAAAVHEQAGLDSVGDTDDHLRAAARHRDQADHHRRAAEHDDESARQP